jgi:hypothetical protein
MTDWYESRIDRQIREAQERGDFDNLPGAGKPLKSDSDRYHDDWWIRDLAERENLSAALPPALAVLREIEELPQILAGKSDEKLVRAYLAKLNDRILAIHRAPVEGPPVVVRTVDVDKIVADWRNGR